MHKKKPTFSPTREVLWEGVFTKCAHSLVVQNLKQEYSGALWFLQATGPRPRAEQPCGSILPSFLPEICFFLIAFGRGWHSLTPGKIRDQFQDHRCVYIFENSAEESTELSWQQGNPADLHKNSCRFHSLAICSHQLSLCNLFFVPIDTAQPALTITSTCARSGTMML